jgi:hypothetical protein
LCCCRLISSKNYEGLEDLVLLSKNVFGCDRDYMFLTWVKAVQHDPAKVRQAKEASFPLIIVTVFRLFFQRKDLNFSIYRTVLLGQR